MTEARKRASKNYDAKNTKTYCIKLNKNTDADLIRILEGVDNVQGYIKELIRQKYLGGRYERINEES